MIQLTGQYMANEKKWHIVAKKKMGHHILLGVAQKEDMKEAVKHAFIDLIERAKMSNNFTPWVSNRAVEDIQDASSRLLRLIHRQKIKNNPKSTISI